MKQKWQIKNKQILLTKKIIIKKFEIYIILFLN